MEDSTESKSVLITGAGSGIGKATTLYLDGKGFTLFPTVFNEEQRKALDEETSPRCHPIVLNISSAEDLERALKEVEGKLGTQGLDGLVNNAGIIATGPLEYLKLDALRKLFEVNVTSQLAVTQTFLPLLKAAKGRLVIMSSISGRSVLPMIGPYSATKFAMEALCDGLRMELKRWGILVSTIEPGSVATPIMGEAAGAIERASTQSMDTLMKEYGDVLEGMVSGFKGSSSKGTPPVKVARVVEHALTSKSPKARYLVGRVAYLRRFVQMIPDKLRDKVILWALKVKLIR